MTPQEFEKLLARHAIKIDQLIHKDLPVKLGNVAVSAFKRNFQDEGFFGSKWKDVQRHRLGTGADAQRKILTGTGDLGRSIQYIVSDAMVTVISDLEYSRVHNDGGTTRPTVTEKMRKFAWAKFYENGGGKKADELTEEALKWMSIATTKKEHLTVTIHKRQFIGDHPTLDSLLKDKIIKELDKKFK